MMLLAKHGGGVGIGINMIRPAGAKITGNGTSDGVVHFCKIYKYYEKNRCNKLTTKL